MKSILTVFMLGLLLIFGFSAIIGAVGFIIDIVKWTKRPEKYTTVEEDLSKSIPTVKNLVEVEEVRKDSVLNGYGNSSSSS